jgi:hypothetical protein
MTRVHMTPGDEHMQLACLKLCGLWHPVRKQEEIINQQKVHVYMDHNDVKR